MKKSALILTAISLVMSALLTACGDKNESSPSEQSTASNSPAASSSEKVTLSIGSWRVEDVEGYKKIIAEFNKANPNITVEFKPTADQEYNTVLNTALMTGGGPDIVHMRPYAPGSELGDNGYLAAINDLPGLNTIPADLLASSTGKDGKIYGVPIALNATQIFYNKKIFADLQLSEPQTWDELMKVADTLKSNKITPFAVGSKDGWILSLVHSAIAPGFYGGTAFEEQLLKGEKKFTSPEFVKSIQAMKDLAAYFPDNYVGLGMDDMRNLFVTEQAGMFIMGDWEIAVVESMNPDLQLGMFPIPKPDGSKPTVTTWVDGSFGVNANSPHKEEALKFLEFAASKSFGQLMASELKRASAIPGVPGVDELTSKVADNAVNHSTPYNILIHFDRGNPTLKTALQDALQAMYLNKLTPEKAAEEIQKNADSWFKPGQ
ncbi:ABC transporter substrate-binding protein [Cohnella faecalis]|uniref:Probable sugar-binding periplasmic protein n=1 Tax=Cohnella faecalis TaxID=2315694 RepID=A0A398CH36_9BACL|nr:extracellular solute-binding protein [Cohnella faecalis]RIE01282.1 extracellular solute-binding protein [Cohnella faecalis]